jgi:hypothetical protein
MSGLFTIILSDYIGAHSLGLILLPPTWKRIGFQ